MLELVGNRESALNVLGITGAIAVTALAVLTDFRRDPVSKPLVSGMSGVTSRLGDVFSGPIPLVLRLAVGMVPAARLVAATFAVLGSLLTRFAWVAAGRESSKDPELVLRSPSR